MTFDLTQNRIRTDLLTAEELAAMKAAKHGWEMIYYDMTWKDVPDPAWIPDYIYRAKPAPRPTIICNGVEVPEPVRGIEKDGEYWIALPDHEDWACSMVWANDACDRLMQQRGLIHLTEADAVSHAKAMAKAGCV